MSKGILFCHLGYASVVGLAGAGGSKLSVGFAMAPHRLRFLVLSLLNQMEKNILSEACRVFYRIYATSVMHLISKIHKN